MDPLIEQAQQVLPKQECEEVYKGDLSKPIPVEDKWKLLPAFLKIKGFVRQHIDSFNYLIETDMGHIMQANREIISDVDPRIYLIYNAIRVETPVFEERGVVGTGSRTEVTPNECRLRDLTYSGAIKVDITYTQRVSDRIEKRDSTVTIGRIPIMLRSSKCHLHGKSPEELAALRECPLDPGGYFIVKGVEKVALVQENLAKNRILIEKDAKGCFCAIVNSSTHLAKSRTVLVQRNDRIKLAHNSFTEEINIMIILKAMGCVHEQEVIQTVGTESSFQTVLHNTMHDCFTADVYTQEQALAYVGNKFVPETYRSATDKANARSKSDRAADFLANVVLCHIPVHEWNYRNKAVTLCIMMRRLLMAQQDPSILDDKDYYGNKRLETAGSFLSLMFEDLFKVFNQQIKHEADSMLSKSNRASVFDFELIMKKNNGITNGIQYAISSGNWLIKRFRMDKKGVTQVLCRYSYIAALGMMTRVASGVDASLKLAGPRSLQPSQWGMLCPADTPEGEKCGLVKNISLMCMVTNTVNESPIADICLDLGVEDIEMVSGDEVRRNYTVFINGHLLGIHRYPNLFIRQYRELRRRGRINTFASIQMNVTLKCITISSDEGRVCRPLIIVDEGRPRITRQHLVELAEGVRNYMDFVKSGIIEYVDVNEENDSYIAIREADITHETTHLEIEPFTILGVVAGLIPFPHHNQSPRNTYQCAMGKQAMGCIALNQQVRIDTVLYLLLYPQKPMVKTRTIDLIGFEQLPAGNNCMVAVMSYSGYDIEDAQIWNKSSVQRGLGRCMLMKKFSVSLRKQRTSSNALEELDDIVLPKPADGGMEDMAQLDDDGIVPRGARVKNGDILVNKHIPAYVTGPNGTREIRHVPAQLRYKGIHPAIVDQVAVSTDDEQKIVKVLLRETRQPEFGDKFSSRHGQKGVCGLLVHQADLPFNHRGMPPDLIMNPHGFPSRMTVGKMIEMISGKAGLTKGKHGYASIFGDQTDYDHHADKVQDIGESLVRAGYSYHGKDLMTSGLTGEQMPAYVFFGPIYYQKLKHMVLDKMHARSTGRRAMVTRQPTEGRSRGGGMRLGEMERDCLVGYGAAMLLNERLMVSSDSFRIYVCGECGLMGYSGYCKYCDSYDKVSSIQIPYACKLLFQEMMAMNIIPRLKLSSL
eukprot:Sspe_Gene.77373::Locus_48340_Transcript_1_1_Confidence_1.000_Length_3591::g.77373::m.77373/K03021/RPC2, POLR3B; DNA-directed RNA polymerase III subunit RPC2